MSVRFKDDSNLIVTTGNKNMKNDIELKWK